MNIKNVEQVVVHFKDFKHNSIFNDHLVHIVIHLFFKEINKNKVKEVFKVVQIDV